MNVQPNKIKASAANTAVGVGLMGVLISGFLLSVPPGDLPIYVGLTMIWCVAVILGSRWQRWLAMLMIAFCVVMAFKQISDGKDFDQKHPGLRHGFHF